MLILKDKSSSISRSIFSGDAWPAYKLYLGTWRLFCEIRCFELQGKTNFIFPKEAVFLLVTATVVSHKIRDRPAHCVINTVKLSSCRKIMELWLHTLNLGTTYRLSEWLISRPGLCTSWKRDLYMHWIGDWLDSEPVLTFWSRETFVASAGNATKIFRFSSTQHNH
jgi:hypothetical protein